MGLCYKCAVPWSKDHKCAPEVLLVVEAVWDAFDVDDVQEPSHSDSLEEEQVFLALSKAAILGNSSA